MPPTNGYTAFIFVQMLAFFKSTVNWLTAFTWVVSVITAAARKALASASNIVSELLVASAEPATFVAVTAQVIANVASACTSVYVDEVALAILLPFLFHW